MTETQEKQRIPLHGVIGAEPLSETLIPKIKLATREQCVEDLRSLAIENPTTVISRNFYRVHGKYAESCWNSVFGTFEEFKRQSGLKLTRQQHALERNIAKHASADHYRRANEERAGYAETYLRDKPGRYKTRIFCSDLHDEEVDPFFWRVLVDAVRRVQPDSFTIVGDGLDLPEFGKYNVDPREWGPARRIKAAHALCEDIRNVFDGQFDWIEGNHEYRMLRHLSDETPALKTVLSELHGMSIRDLLGLDKYEINYIAKADLAAWTQRDIAKEVAHNYKVYDECFLAHHFPEGRNMGLPGCSGHHHRHVVWSSYSPMFGAHEWHQIGCGHKRDASYCAGENWHTGFLIAHIDTETRQVIHEYVQVTDFAVVGGQFYYRDANGR
jgi:hypothetical protein